MRDTRRIILDHSLKLFNRIGVLEVSTNHIAADISIGPGVLYYHFRNKEAIVRDLFLEMMLELEILWSEAKEPDDFFLNTLRLFWKYRCFHREMTPLRRRDPQLNRLWSQHIKDCHRLLSERIGEWVAAGRYPRLEEDHNRRLAIIIVLTVAGSVLQVYESPLKKPRESIIDQAVETLMDCLVQLGNDRF